MVSDYDMIKFRVLCICGTLSRVHGVCHVPRFGFWGVTDLVIHEINLVRHVLKTLF
ncbi:hypothetical protein SLEP1_g24589 [Rubroshorea leprosula]|uniref:Uncharacterized protein n=1 Tax=Rubroshorea leprosula TaxID=152421 RepID=A0AAV5JLG4_9ROSI|nr:hypothetical protein SLEP1_g24589 [Rubroshorea leprosula]